MSTVVNTTSYFTFGSPRYNSINTLSTNLIPEDNEHFTSLNGTYDKFFPLYRLIETDEPVHELVQQDSSSSPIKGGLKIHNTSYKTFKVDYGAIKGSKERPYNSNLEKQSVSYSNWSSIRLNSAWCVIQQQEKTTNAGVEYIPTLLVRALGTNATIVQIHALDLDADIKNTITQWKSTDFPIGLIVKYKDNAWRCIKPTRKIPPEKAPKDSQLINGDWSYMNYNDNVFNADIFFLSESGDSNYLKEVKDSKRKFHPVKDNKDDDLVCWNLAYYDTGAI
jgi:hypothetical protein